MLTKKEIHIVSFNVPYPPNYGGIIDVFYKIVFFYNAGYSVNLHCFLYNRDKSSELEKYCKSVQYYKRPTSLFHLFSKTPFIVKTRAIKKLFRNLQKDSFPVIFEGLHTTYFLNQLNKNKRAVIVRAHNVEHEYYKGLAKKEYHLLKKMFFKNEAKKLERYQYKLDSSIKMVTISKNDYDYFSRKYPAVYLIPAFHPFSNVSIKPGKSDYILYHGDLSVTENIEAVEFILRRICPFVNFKFMIAGRTPSKRVQKIIKFSKNAELIANPSDKALQDLIYNAQINLLITFQNTGLKLKLINALYNGRHCIVNNEMVHGSQLESLCHIKNDAKDIISEINKLVYMPVTETEISHRKEILLKIVNNAENGQKLINLLD